MSDFQVSPELLAIYLEDARQHLEALDHCLLTLEREGPDEETVTAVLGPLHTLKGNSGMIGLSGIKDYVHRLEDVFAHVRDGTLVLQPEAFDRLFAGATALRDSIEHASREGTEGRDLVPERMELERMVAGGSGAGPAARPAGLLVPPREPASAVPGGASERRADTRYTARSSVVRVEFAQLDHLLNLVGELIIHRTKLQEMARTLAQETDQRGAARDLLAAVHQVAGVSQQLQETVMDVRMLPIRHVFERFPRLVRDLARETGKEIELILEGESTRIDKAIIDEIGEPLVHLVRNSVDHGIEPPAERVANGKTPTGTILLSATQESNHVVITIMDDGAGIDAATVRTKAVERGLLKADEGLSDRDVVQLIFSQGFSTRESITEVSGRGVGLDVVLKSIERLNGLVEVETVPGVGTKFIIQLPLTLAIIAALLVEVSGRTYAIPLGSVVESLKLRPEEIHTISGRETLRIRDRIVPLVRLARLFGLPEEEGPEVREYAVVIGRGDKRVGVIVNRLRGQQEVVIKALDPAVSGEAVGMAGATIMGDGRVVLILDVASLFDGKRLPSLQGGRLTPALEA
ncbi:MAG TPA: chemotaxis protein CheA [Vicinamibacteria bacterium]|nr:chemotaxis protein CheA [Vicinamibacteria bacterium]